MSYPTAEYKINLIIEEAIESAFDRIEDRRGELDLKPSEIRKILQTNYDLGDFYEDWYREGDEGWE